MATLIGAVELGGTKVLAAIATDLFAPLRQTRIPTGEPAATLGAIADFFSGAEGDFGPLAAIGIGAFGPIDIIPSSPHWGRLGPTSKSGWEGADIVSPLKRFGCPVSLDTDVNAAAVAEMRWGAAQGLTATAYLTVGTGIGGGVIIDGQTLRGAMHPEIGHVRIKRHPADVHRSCCPFHADCAEGLASGPAIIDRFGMTIQELAPDHPFLGILTDYLGQLCATLVLVLSPQKIVLGGGVMAGTSLHAAVDAAMRIWLGGYATPPHDLDPFIVPPALGDSAGLIGAFALAQDAVRRFPLTRRPSREG